MTNAEKENSAAGAVDAAWEAFVIERDRRGGEGLAYYQSVHPLWTPQMASMLPTEEDAGKDPDPVCYYRLVAPHDGRCAWHVMAATERGDDTVLFVYVTWATVEGCQAELGHISLAELRSLRGPFFLNVETERFYQPQRLSAVKRDWGLAKVQS